MSDTETRTSVRESESEATTESTGECPECDGSVVHDEEHGDTACENCGLIVDEDEIDLGPEWRAYDARDRAEKSRVGAPATKLIHDDGLSTNVGWQDRDGYGQTLWRISADAPSGCGSGTSAIGRRIRRIATSNRRSARSTGWRARSACRRTSAKPRA